MTNKSVMMKAIPLAVLQLILKPRVDPYSVYLDDNTMHVEVFLHANFKAASPLPHRLHRRSAPKKAIEKGMPRARVSRRQPSKASGRLIGLGWSFGQ